MKKVIISLIIIIGLSYGGYRYLLTFASDHLIDQVRTEVLTDETLNELIEEFDVASMMKHYQSNLPSSNNSSTPKEETAFSTKEEATKLLVSKFSFGEIRDISSKASRGLTTEEQVELEKKVMDRLTPDEIEALLVIGLSEIMNK
jgi:DNA-directed RNA polymerase specialized sigma24 family protein